MRAGPGFSASARSSGLGPEDRADFVIEAVERIGMSAFKVNHSGTGSAQYHPRMILALLIYCYANGIFSSRRIERATHRDIGVRSVAANAQALSNVVENTLNRRLYAMDELFRARQYH